MHHNKQLWYKVRDDEPQQKVIVTQGEGDEPQQAIAQGEG